MASKCDKCGKSEGVLVSGKVFNAANSDEWREVTNHIDCSKPYESAKIQIGPNVNYAFQSGFGTGVASCHICNQPMTSLHNSLCWVAPFKQELLDTADRYAQGDSNARDELVLLLKRLG